MKSSAWSIVSSLLLMSLFSLHPMFGQSNAWEELSFPASPAWGGNNVANFVFLPGGEILLGGWLGMLRSSDDGVTWSKVSNQDTWELKTDGAGRVVSASDNGLIRSTDRGETWMMLKSFNDRSEHGRAVDVGPNGELLFSVHDGPVYRSTDDGASWKRIKIQVYGGDNVVAFSRVTGNLVFAITAYGKLFRSVTNGAHWKRVRVTRAPIPYPRSVSITANAKSQIYAACTYMKPQHIFHRGVFKSTDGGMSFLPISLIDSLPGNGAGAIAADTSGNFIYGDAGGGMFQSTDDGRHWQTMNSGIPNGDIWALAISPGHRLFASTSQGTGYRSVNILTIQPVANRRAETEINIPPASFALLQNYPNPFNPVTNIEYALASDQHVNLTVSNILGQVVATLVDENQGAGSNSVEFDASRLPSGLYFYRLRAGAFVESKTMMLVK